MGIVKPSDDVIFADEKVRDAWLEVKEKDPELAKQLLQAKNAIFCDNSH